MIAFGKLAFGFLKGLPWQIYAALAALSLILAAWHQYAVAIDAAHAAGVADATAIFTKGQADADRKALDHVAKVTSETAVIKQETSDVLTTRDADVDRRVDAMRLQHNQSVIREANRLNLPGGPFAFGEPPEASICKGLAFDDALESLTHNAKADNQINALIDFIERGHAALATPEGISNGS